VKNMEKDKKKKITTKKTKYGTLVMLPTPKVDPAELLPVLARIRNGFEVYYSIAFFGKLLLASDAMSKAQARSNFLEAHKVAFASEYKAGKEAPKVDTKKVKITYI